MLTFIDSICLCASCVLRNALYALFLYCIAVPTSDGFDILNSVATKLSVGTIISVGLMGSWRPGGWVFRLPYFDSPYLSRLLDLTALRNTFGSILCRRKVSCGSRTRETVSEFSPDISMGEQYIPRLCISRLIKRCRRCRMQSATFIYSRGNKSSSHYRQSLFVR